MCLAEHNVDGDVLKLEWWVSCDGSFMLVINKRSMYPRIRSLKEKRENWSFTMNTFGNWEALFYRSLLKGPEYWCSWYREEYGGSSKIWKIDLPYDSAIPLLGINMDKTIIWKDTCTPIFILIHVPLYSYSFMYPYIHTIAKTSDQIRSDQSLSCVRLFATPWIEAHQSSLSITNSWSSLRLTSIESVNPSSHLILCRPLLLLPPIPPSIRVFSNESTLRMRWPKY